jgi:chorismate mutase
MAGDWIKMTHALPEKPEVLAIAGKTGFNRFEVVGRLFTLWRWFDINTTDGNAAGVTLVTLEECLFGYHANARFVDSVLAVHWLHESDDGISVVKFDEHISESAKTRAQTAKRVAKSKLNAKGNAEGNAETVTQSVTKTVPREEKRREEKIETNTAPAGAFDLPSWIPSDTWAAYCKVRTGKKAKNEPHALGLIVKDLERYRSAGHDPIEVLNNSIKSGWAGVFEPKTKPGAQPIAATSHDPDSRSAIEAEGVAKGIGPWNEINEQWHSYKARVRGKQNGFDLTQLAAMAAKRQGALQ